MEILQMLSEKGKPLLVIDGAKFYLTQTLKSGEIKWRCVQKLCTAKVYTDADNNILKRDKDHNHVLKQAKLAHQQIRNSVKLKAKINLNELPRKLINSEIQNYPSISKSLTRRDVYNIRKAMYKARRSHKELGQKSCYSLNLKVDEHGTTNPDGEYN